MKRVMILAVFVAALLMLVLPANAQMSPAVEVSDQPVLDGTVTVAKVVSEGPGFIVIHKDNGSGSFGPVIGYRWVNPGENFNITVNIDAAQATITLYAMLHVDSGEVGVYEFGTVEGADGPVVVDGAPLSPPFNVAVIHAHDQFIENNTFVADAVIMDGTGFLAIHSDNEGRPGPVIGYASVESGMGTNVAVELDPAGMTDVLWPMLHVDTGQAGVYEFGTVEGADGPVRVGDRVAVTPIWTVPHVRMSSQIVVYGDGMEMEMAPTATAQSVLSEGQGFLVIHTDNNGAPGPVAGYAAVEAGFNANVVVELDPAVLTPVLWPMLHVDTGEVGTYEFGTVEGADGPVRVNDQVLTFAIHAAPSITYEVSAGDTAGTIVVSAALIDAPGWLAIHTDNNGAPGPVAGAAPLLRGWNGPIVVTVDESMMTATVFPMLHYDTGEAGVYEFGTVEGADGPVRVGGNVVVGPAEVMMGDGG